ncbi:uncharacterized protein F5147DRAFT_653522 [Suillus discolor]|uniref:Uncharacterized protein n=1 Tax=Suillus discolor TaxID=1912936 RepID=A0A9P7F5L0_9AGAM|nr:uncharacterized protein F5147DRAFT_653522 [Suillus discolor]KAG2106919.1 hypothetical protein F5147DRAFT_653522 [Suillus discolor]
MPPRKTKGGGKKAASGGDEGGSHLHLDQRPIEPTGQKKDIGKETQKLDAQVAKCKAGVAWVNLLDIADTLKFGVYNDRPEKDEETNKLVTSFKTLGITPMKDTAAIPIIVDMKRVENKDSLLKNFDEPEKVSELKMKDKNHIVVASGQHRLSALKRYTQSLRDEVEMFDKKRNKIMGMSKLTPENVQQHNEYRAQQCDILDILHNIGQWGVIVYDQGKLLADGDELANHLSRNSTLHEYKETDEESLVRALKKIKVVYDTSPENKRDTLATNMLSEIRATADKNSRLQKVLHHDRLCMFLATRLLTLGRHVRHRQEFSVTWLSKSIDVCIGIYMSWCEIRLGTLRKLGSEDEFASYETVMKLLDKAEGGNEEAKKQTKAVTNGCDMAIWAQVLEAMDKHANDAFSEIKDQIGEMSPKYIMHLSSYRSKVIKTLRDTWHLTSNANIKNNQILTHLDSIVARVALHLTPQEGKTEAPEPLLGGFMMTYAWASFTKIEEGIGEVCRWFEALIDYYRPLHPKTHTMDDWSSVMLANIAKDPRFADHGHNNPREVTKIIWTHRRTLMMRLNNCIVNDKHKLPPRPKEKKEVEAEYFKLPEAETLASEALGKFLVSKRTKNGPKNRNLAMEAHVIAGMMALHTTGWDWLSPALKNGPRDIEPCYRPKLLRDKYVGALRRLIEQALSSRLEKEWVWWDGLKLGESQLDPKEVLKTIEGKAVVEQQQTRDRLLLEDKDRDALNKFVSHVMSMSCVRSGTSPHSLLSADVARPLVEVIKGIELNCARLRYRILNNDPTKPFEVDVHKVALGIDIPESYEDPFTMASADGEEDEPLEKEPAPKKKNKKGKSRAVDVEGPPVPEQDKEPTNAPARSESPPVHHVDDPPVDTQTPVPQSKTLKTSAGKPKPRPVPRKQRQPSPHALDDNIEIIDDSLNSVGRDVQTNDDESVTPRPPVLTLTEQTSSSDGPSGNTETDQAPAHATVLPTAGSIVAPEASAHGTVASADNAPVPPPSSAVATVPSEETNKDPAGILTGTVPSLTPSPSGLPHGFGTDDTSWYDPNAGEDDGDHDMQDRSSSSEDENGDEDSRSTSRVSDFDDPRDATYVPTQPLTQKSLPPRTKEPRGVVAAPTKRSRAATGASSSSSMHGRGRQQKKKSKVTVEDDEDDEEEGTVIPGV